MVRDRDRPTMQDIADKVGVSKALVSLVFRNAAGPSAETRLRVFAAADELGYRVNRTAALMTARRSHHLGVTINIRNSFHTEISNTSSPPPTAPDTRWYLAPSLRRTARPR